MGQRAVQSPWDWGSDFIGFHGTMRRLNLRLTAVILVVVLVLGAGVHLFHGFQMRRNADVFLREAERAKKENNRPEAVRQLRNYLELSPNDAKAVADLGILLADMAEANPNTLEPNLLQAAYEVLENALRLAPERDDLRRRLAPIAVTMGRFPGNAGRYRDALAHLDRLMQESPKDPELLLLKGRSQEGIGDYGEADKTYRKVIAVAPSQLEGAFRLADLLQRRLEKPKEAEAVMARMVASNAQSSEAHLGYGRFLLGARTKSPDDSTLLDRAVAEAAAALQLAPDSADALFLSAQCAIEKKDFDRAREYGSQLVEKYPESPEVYSLLADVEVRTNHHDEAIVWLRKGAEAASKTGASKARDLLWSLANLLLDDGQIDEAEKLALRLREEQYPLPLADYLLARTLYAREDWLKASREFERLRPELAALPNVVKQVDFWLGGCYGQLGRIDQQLAAYRRALNVDPFWFPARLGTAQALLALRRVEEAQGEYRELIRIAGNPATGAIDLAQVEILRNLWAKRAERDWTEAERLIDLAEQANPGHPRIPVLRAEILVGQDRIQEAEQLLQTARTQKPDELTFAIALVSLVDRQRDWDRAEKFLDEAQKQFGDRVALRLTRAQHLTERLGKEAAEPLRALAANADAFPPAERSDLWRGLAAASLAVGDYGQARTLYRQVSRIEPHNLQIRLRLFELALQAEDGSGLEEVLKEIRQIEGEGAYWHYGMALVLGLQAKDAPEKLDEALAHLAKCRAEQPEWSRVPLLAAEFYVQKAEIQHKADQEDLAVANYEKAIDNYQEAIELGERNPRAIQKAFLLLTGQQRFREADQVLRLLDEQQSPFSPDLSRMASEVSLRLDDFDRALELARQAARDSKDYRNHLWLGRVLGVLAQRARAEEPTAEADSLAAEAEAELRQAVALADSSPAVWVDLIQFLARTGQMPKAEAAIVEARGKIPAAQAPRALAQCYEEMNQPDLAEKEYLAAIAASPEDVAVLRQVIEFYLKTGKALQAETSLRKITSGSLKASQDEQVWARRSLAVVLLGKGDYVSLEQGLALIDENLNLPTAANRDEPSIQDQRVKALLLAAHPEREKRDEAAALLEKVVQNRRVSSPDDRFALARLYLSQGPSKWGLAARHFRTLLGTSPDNPRYLSTYAAALLARKEITEAELCLNGLEKVAPGQLTTITLRAQTLCLRGKFDQAVALLQGFLEDPEAQGANRTARIGLVAALMEDLGRRLNDPSEKEAAQRFAEEAEKLYRQYVELVPDQKLLLAGFLARQNRLDEALTVAEEASPAASSDLVAATMVSLMAAEKPASSASRAEKLLQEMLEKQNRPISLLVVLADYYSVHNRCEEAEAIYREILKKNPKDVMGLNNLAVLLALQKKNLKEAERFMDQAIDLTGPTANSLDSRALVLLACNKPKEALADIDRVIADTPVAAAYYRRAQILLVLGRREEARQAFKTARDKGLKGELLHPLESSIYEDLRKTLL